MAETIRDVTIRIKLQQAGGKLKSPDVKQAQRDLDQTVKKQQQNIKQLSEQQNRAVKETADAAGKLGDRSIQVGEGLQEIGDGFFTAARGAAFLFTNTEEGFGEMVKTLADVQGGFDTFRGTLQVTKGSLNALGVSAGPAGIAGVGLASLTGAISIGVSLYQRFNAEAQESKRQQEQAAKTQKRLADRTRDYADALRMVTDRERNSEEFFRQRDALIQILTTTNKLIAAEQRLALVRQEQGQFRAGAGGRFKDMVFPGDKPVNARVPQGLGFRNVKLSSNLEMLRAAGLAKDPDEAAKQLLEGKKFFQEVENRKFGPFGRFGGRTRKEEIEIPDEMRKGAGQFILQNQQRELGLQKRKLQLRQDELQAVKDIIGAEREKLNTLKEQLKTQQESVKSQQSAAGRLTKGQQNRLRQLIPGLKAGTLNRGQLEEAERLGGGIDAVRKAINEEFAKRGSGVADFASRQLGDPLSGKGSEVEATKKKIEERKQVIAGLANTFADQAEAAQQGIASMEKSITSLTEQIKNTQNKVLQLEQQVNQGLVVARNP